MKQKEQVEAEQELNLKNKAQEDAQEILRHRQKLAAVWRDISLP